ncbi:NACHT C-terminal alpha/beta 1 domain-containing protein [Microcoleus sp. D3_18a_C4]|uniref:NACHT C-terminal alpha/beta 1 domain-containing protein n=1 Tax=Microcoleus sp. D3_18a_C4 TaxID=3055332 RepID=UPI00403FA4AE
MCQIHRGHRPAPSRNSKSTRNSSQLLEWEKYPILIFYENAIATTQGFSQTFLDALTRFKGCRNLCIYA